ncbi:MAG: hypothetical protein ACO1Q7_10880 [Gemmatimonas sp.]
MLLKSWMETRWRLVLMLLLNLFIGSVIVDDRVPVDVWVARFNGMLPMIFAMNGIVLAGSGISSQISQRPGQVVHPSMMFLLSLPVSRTRIVLVRQAVGAGATLLLFCMSMTALVMVAPETRGLLFTGAGALYITCTVAAVLTAYAMSALLSTVLDQLWQTYGAMAVVAAIVGLFPASRFWSAVLGENSAADASVVTTSMLGVGACAVLITLLIVVSIRIVRRKQF